MSIDWSALGQVTGVILAATVGLVTVFTMGIVATARRPQQDAATDGRQPGAVTGGAPAGGRPTVLARSAGYLCFLLCGAAVAYGIYLIVTGGA